MAVDKAVVVGGTVVVVGVDVVDDEVVVVGATVVVVVGDTVVVVMDEVVVLGGTVVVVVLVVVVGVGVVPPATSGARTALSAFTVPLLMPPMDVVYCVPAVYVVPYEKAISTPSVPTGVYWFCSATPEPDTSLGSLAVTVPPRTVLDDHGDTDCRADVGWACALGVLPATPAAVTAVNARLRRRRSAPFGGTLALRRLLLRIASSTSLLQVARGQCRLSAILS